MTAPQGSSFYVRSNQKCTCENAGMHCKLKKIQWRINLQNISNILNSN